MKTSNRRTKIVATIGPASESPEGIRSLIDAGMNVARLNFSHGSHEDHARTVRNLREISAAMEKPITILQDLQGPKVRVCNLPNDSVELVEQEIVELLPESEFKGHSESVEGLPIQIPIDYPQASEEARVGMQILLADGLFELEVHEIRGSSLHCRVIEGGTLTSRKGVNFPELNLQLPALTEKDKKDVLFGAKHRVDWVSLSFVRSAADVRLLKQLLTECGGTTRIIAKIEKPQAVDCLDEILAEVDGIMVARGDLGVEMSPERVPMLQKHIIEQCNRRGLPVITATQMLESMIHDPRPTRAEASDVANAIIDGTDAVMLSGESAVGAYPRRAVRMMDRIAREVESTIEFKSYPAFESSETHALCEASNSMAKLLAPSFIVILTTTGHTAHCVAAERPDAPVVALTTDPRAYHSLNLFWGIQPLLVSDTPTNFDELIVLAESTLRDREMVGPGERILVIGGVPTGKPRGANFIKIHPIK